MRDLIGRTLGHYRIVEKIGEGGMGVVYRAHDERLDRDVAIKVLPEQVAGDSDRLKRFEREAKAVAKLDHPNILAIHDFRSDDGVAYAVMELLEGESLRELISRGGITTGKAVEYARAIADGLAAAHGKNIVHRDLKPENVFLTTDGRIKILDFGLAKLKFPEADLATETPTETLGTAPGKLLGTLTYMAPEQLQGKAADQRSDIFALGVVLYEMLTGRRPFGGGTTAEVVAEIIKTDPAPISEPLPPTVASMVSKCLEKRPEDRFSSAHDLSLILGSIDSKSTVPPSQDKSFLQRRWPYLGAVVVAAVIALVFLLPPESLFERSEEESAETSIPRIVVLPFENLGQPEDEYFADGITEEIISKLAAVSRIQVISRTSAMYYKGRSVPIKQIGDELDVGWVLEGTIRWDRAGGGLGRVRVTPQLIRVADDSHLWANQYDRVLEDIFSVQTEIAESVIGQLEVALLQTEEQRLKMKPTGNIEAYQAYLTAMNIGITERGEDLELAVDMFKRAIELDPDFALAYAGLAEASSMMVHYRIDLSSERLKEAENAAYTAVKLAPDLAESHLARGYFSYHAFRDYDSALQEMYLARDRKPSDARVWAGISYVLRRQGRFREALLDMERAIRLDPRDDTLPWNQGITYMYLRDYERATQLMEQAVSLAPDRVEVYYWLAEAYRLWDGSPARARAVLDATPRKSHEFAIYASLIQDLYERDYELALDRLSTVPERVIRLSRQLLPTDLVQCECLLALHRPNEARSACEKALELLEDEAEDLPGDPRVHSALGKTYALLGRDSDAIRHGEEAVRIWPVSMDAVDGVHFERDLAEIYALVGELDLALEKLDYLLRIPSLTSVADLRFNPQWDPLRDHPRFQALLEKYDTN